MRVARLLIAAFFFLVLASLAHSGGIGVSTGPCEVPEITASFAITDSILPFHFYKVPAFRSPLGRRDLEFLWSDTYAQEPQNRPLVPPGSSEENDLDRFAKTLCEALNNPFGFDRTDIRLVYDYFNVRGVSYRDTTYKTSELEPGFRVADPDTHDVERTHVDTYLWEPNLDLFALDKTGPDDDPLPAGRYPSDFMSSAEDSLTPDPATYHRNSIHLFGPPFTNVDDTGLNRWTRADTIYNQGFNHEFEHCLNNDLQQGQGEVPDIEYTHMLASAAEAIGGMCKLPPRFDVPYTKNLTRADGNGGNYEAWLSFAAYVAYNFRGTDLSGTLAGLSDDLMWRWAKQPDRRLTSLIGRLSPAQCAECSTRVYFQNRSPQDRFRILLHNWRIAQYVNRYGFATSQGDFGFPPQFNFNPIRDIGNWQDKDTVVTDSTNVPHDVTVTRSHISRDSSFVAGRGGAKAHALRFERFGSDYWVLRSDPWVQGANRDLVIRITPEGWCPGIRLMASAITYSNVPGAGDSLWKHPEWATSVIRPDSLDLDSLSIKPLEIVVPNFGLTHKAVLVVMTTSQLTDSDGSENILTYRLNVGLRTGTYLSPNPAVTFRDQSFVNLPTWHPDGDSVAFMRNAGSGFGEIHVKSISQSGSRMLIPGTLPQTQAYPDWSPRGDWVAYSQESTTTTPQCDIRAYNTKTGERRILASSADNEFSPAFSPNGQRLVYIRSQNYGGTWQLRRINLVDTSDVVLLQQTSIISSPRWSPDGQSIYFLSTPTGNAGFTLYAVSSNGGSPILKSHLIPGAWTLDLPLGKGRIIAEEDWRPVLCASTIQSPTRRLVARDTIAAESEMLFLSGGIKLYVPRLSFDNTRVAYAADSAGARDIRVAQIGFNHAPLFGSLSDAGFLPFYPVNTPILASDPDGDPLTYEAVFLPPGATYSSSGQFVWPSPPDSGQWYTVFRAKDPSGGVDNRVILITIIGAPGGCPMVDVRSSAGWEFENSILGRSVAGEFLTDIYRLRAQPENLGGRYKIRIRENENERTTLDQVRLWSVDHLPSEKAYASASGVVLGERRPAYRVMTHDGRDVTKQLAENGVGFQGQPGEALLVEMNAPGADEPGTAEVLLEEPCCEKQGPAPGGGDRAGVDPSVDQRVDRQWLERTGVLVQVPDGPEGWRTVQHRYPRENSDQVALDLSGHDRLRLVFLGRQRLASLSRMIRTGVAQPVELPLLGARHSKTGDELDSVLRPGGSVATLETGDTLTLDFAATAVPTGFVRTFFVVSRGVYTSDLSQTNRRLLQTQPIPSRFALAQNRPNPFSRTTTIRFELPVSSRVRVEVFDLVGRRVATLADREYPAGYHSVEWDRKTASGSQPSSGVYVYRLIAGTFRDQKKMILLP